MSSPFKFLDAYTREDRDIFFGRDREIEEMYQKVFESKIFLIYGISGTGKTSLINCGLANKFEESDWLPVNVRRGFNINESLWEELKERGGEGEKRRGGEGAKGRGGEREKGRGGEGEKGRGRIVKILSYIYLDHFKPIYLIFDQFEELFIFGNKEERQDFIKIVKSVIDADVRCKFLFSIREEYLAGITEFEGVIPEFMANRMRVEKMTFQHAIEAIEGPCKVRGIDVEEGFAKALLQKLNPEGKEIELTYLQVFLDKVYKIALDRDIREDDKTLKKPVISMTLSLLDKTGDVSDLLGNFLEEQISQLEDPDSGLTVLKAFVSVKGTKRQITEEEISKFSKTFGKTIEDEHITDLLQRFVNLRILRDKDENGRYELRHDRLAMVIYEKITLVEKELIEVRQFVENAYENYKRRGTLLAQDDLDYVNVYKGKLFMGKDLEDFIQKSNSAMQLRIRALKRVTSFSIVALLVIISLMVYYYYLKQDKSRAVDFSIQSLLQKDISPESSFISAYKAYQIDPRNTLTRKAIFDAFYNMLESGTDNNLFNFESGGSEIISTSFSPDDKFIAGILKDNSICIWNRMGKKVISVDFSHPVLALKIAGNNQYFGVLCSDSIVYVLDLKGVKILDAKSRYHILHPDDVFQFSSDGKFMIQVNPVNEIIFTELNSGTTMQVISGEESDVNDIALSYDQNWMAAGLSDGTIRLWNNQGTGDFRFFRMIRAHSGSVWAVDFASNSQFVLSASADSTYSVWNLNGEEVYGSFDWGYPQQNKDPYCDAIFGGSDRGILLTAYYDTGDKNTDSDEVITVNGASYNYYTRVDFSDYSMISNAHPNEYIGKDEDDLTERLQSKQPGMRPDQFDYSPNGTHYALTSADGKKTGIYYADGLNLKVVRGNGPVFSNDGKYLICVQDDKVRLYPAETEEMIRLVMEEKIFGPVNL